MDKFDPGGLGYGNLYRVKREVIVLRHSNLEVLVRMMNAKNGYSTDGGVQHDGREYFVTMKNY